MRRKWTNIFTKNSNRTDNDYHNQETYFNDDLEIVENGSSRTPHDIKSYQKQKYQHLFKAF